MLRCRFLLTACYMVFALRRSDNCLRTIFFHFAKQVNLAVYALNKAAFL